MFRLQSAPCKDLRGFFVCLPIAVLSFGWYYWFLIQLPLTCVECFSFGDYLALSELPSLGNFGKLTPISLSVFVFFIFFFVHFVHFPEGPRECWMPVNYLMPVTQWLTRPLRKCKLPSSPAGFGAGVGLGTQLTHGDPWWHKQHTHTHRTLRLMFFMLILLILN